MKWTKTRIFLAVVLAIYLCDRAVKYGLRARNIDGDESLVEWPHTKRLPEPYVMYKPKQLWPDPRIVLNERGFRHREEIYYNKIRPRVLVVGGSFAAGFGATDADYYQTYLEQAWPEIEWINVARGGYMGPQIMVYYVTELSALAPDGVILLDGANEVAYPVSYGWAPGAPWAWNDYKRMLSKNPFNMMVGWVCLNSHIVRLCRRLWGQNDEQVMNRASAALVKYLDGLQMLYNLWRCQGVEVLHYHQPHITLSKQLSEREEHLGLERMTRLWREVYPAYTRQVTQLSGAYQIPFKPLSDTLDGHVGLWDDFFHLNPDGHKVFGQALVEDPAMQAFVEAVKAKAAQ